MNLFRNQLLISNGARAFAVVSLLLCIIVLALPVAAQEGFVPIAPISGLTDPGTVGQDAGNTAQFLNNLYKFLIGFAAAAAVIMIIWGGLEYSTTDNISKKSEGKAKIQQAILGLVLVLLPVLVFSMINPAILNLSIGWSAIKPPSGFSTNINFGSGSAGGSSLAAPETGCATSTSGPYLEIAACASQADANAYSCKNDLNPTISPCKKYNEDKTQCLDTGVSVFCGKKVEVVYYAYTHLGGAWTSVRGKIVPKQELQQNEFGNGCQTDRGEMTSSITSEGRAFLIQWYLHAFQQFNGCSDTGVEIDTGQGTGVVCYGVQLACVP